MNFKHLFFLLLVSFSGVQAVIGQHDFMLDAQDAYKNGDYHSALEIINAQVSTNPIPEAFYLRGLSNYRLNYLQSAIVDFTSALEKGLKNPEVVWYLASCHQQLHDYDKAAVLYRDYIQNADTELIHQDQARIELRNCLFAAFGKSDTSEKNLLVQNFGSANSLYDELMPVQSPLFGNRFYFTSNRNKGDYKIYAFILENDGSWDSLDTSSEKYNYGKNSFVQDIDGAGSSMLLIEKNPITKRHALVFTNLSSDEEKRINLEEGFFANAEDLMIANSKKIVFTSDALNGYGGYDLFWTEYENGAWKRPVNFGPLVNTPFDERSPCLSSDGTQLYFSSNKAYGYGGFDIYFINPLSNEPAINLGSEINSPSDDLNMRIYDDGHMSIFSSNRKSGKGGFDLYFSYTSLERLFSEKDKNVFHFVLDQLQTFASQPVEISDKTITHDKLIPKKISTIHLLYNDSYDLLHGTNKSSLDRLINQLEKNSDKIHLQVFTDSREPGLSEYIQYNCMKRALSVKEYLVKNGIADERITIESMAQSYPIVKNEFKDNDSLYLLNRRVEIISENHSVDTGAVYTINEIKIPEFAQDPRYELYSLIRDGLYFSVRIASSPRLYKNAVLRLYNDVYMRREGGSQMNDYYVGLYTSVSDAMQLKEKLLKHSGINPSITAFYKGSLLDKSDIQRLSKKYPELSGIE